MYGKGIRGITWEIPFASNCPELTKELKKKYGDINFIEDLYYNAHEWTEDSKDGSWIPSDISIYSIKHKRLFVRMKFKKGQKNRAMLLNKIDELKNELDSKYPERETRW